MSTVTAIVSAYRGADKWLEGRLANLASQSLEPQVIVICQEGSNESDVAWAFAGNNRTAHVLQTGGIPTIYQAWNQAIVFMQKECPTDYITNANSDDRLHPDGLKVLAKALDNNPGYGASYFDIGMIEQDGIDAFDLGVPWDEVLALLKGKYEWAEGGLDQLLKGCFLGPMPMWRASLHDAHGLFDEEMHSAGDYEWWLRLASAGVTFYHVRKALYGIYLVRSDSAEHREPVRSLWEASKAKGRYKPKREAVG